MSVALDLGTHGARSLQIRGARLVARQCRSIAAYMPDGELQRHWLHRMAAPYVACDDHLAVLGDHAEQLAQLFPLVCHDLFADGLVPFHDPVTRQLIALLIDGLIPQASAERDVCCLAHAGSAEPGEAEAGRARRREFISRVVALRGYELLVVNPALALVLAEMERSQFSGLGISLGASGIELGLVRHGRLDASRTIPRGGRWIDEQLARHAGLYGQDPFRQRVLDLEEARRRKERTSLISPEGEQQRLVCDLYRRLVSELADAITQLVDQQPMSVRSIMPLTVVVGGGVARIDGFGSMMQEELWKRLPRSVVGTIRIEQSPEFGILRGCQIHATLDARTREPVRLSA